MVKAKQKSIRIFDIVVENEADFLPYMEKNLILLQEYLLILSGDITKNILNYLEKKNICYKLTKDCNIKLSTKSNTTKPKKQIEPKSTNTPQQNVRIVKELKIIKTLLVQKPVRSGEELIYEGDVTIFGRVNSAAKVVADGNVEVYGTIDGLVQCDGDYMIAKDIGKGYIIFNGDILDKDKFDGNLKRVTLSNDGVVIKDIFETNHN
jgi:septum site-determining protein MinC